jgi:LDH2 family malate/lactate/ureidoglycolate dehydrogenase
VQRFQEAELLRFAQRVLTALDTPPATARIVAESLVEADVRGVATHGVVRLPSYRRQVDDQEVRAQAQPRVVHEHGATAYVDGGQAFGALTAEFCIDLATERAERHGVGAVSARGCMHFGAAARYALRAAQRGLVGIVATNTPGVMAPYGGLAPVVGNNPFAIAAPMPGGRPAFVLDMAQTVVARGRIKLAEMNEMEIPEGWALDADGEPTTDPTAALAGALLPFGGYKGYGLALAVEVLTAALAGAGLSSELANTSMTGRPAAREGVKVGSVGNLFIALAPDAFAGRDVFGQALLRIADAVTSVSPRAGFSEVLLPGQLEARATADAAENGVPLSAPTVAQLGDLAAGLGIASPVPMLAAS